jgi:2'-5' RNA ligase
VARGFQTEQRPFKAHLTLARKVRRPPADAVFEPLAWPAHEFSLVESTTDPAGSRYERLATWPIGG